MPLITVVEYVPPAALHSLLIVLSEIRSAWAAGALTVNATLSAFAPAVTMVQIRGAIGVLNAGKSSEVLPRGHFYESGLAPGGIQNLADRGHPSRTHNTGQWAQRVAGDLHLRRRL